MLTSDYYIPDAYLAAQQLTAWNATAAKLRRRTTLRWAKAYSYERGHVLKYHSAVGYDNSISDAPFEPVSWTRLIKC